MNFEVFQQVGNYIAGVAPAVVGAFVTFYCIQRFLNFGKRIIGKGAATRSGVDVDTIMVFGTATGIIHGKVVQKSTEYLIVNLLNDDGQPNGITRKIPFIGYETQIIDIRTETK